MSARLPSLLRRLYLEVANGGFGPGPGLVGVRGGWTTSHGKSMEDLYDQMLDATTENRAWIWPRGLVPIADLNGVFLRGGSTTDDGRVVEFDFEELDEGGRGDRGWWRAFSERAPSLATWLETWLDAPSPPTTPQFVMPQAPTSTFVPEVTRCLESQTPERRASLGLPEKGWGKVLFGEAWGNDPRDGSAA